MSSRESDLCGISEVIDIRRPDLSVREKKKLVKRIYRHYGEYSRYNWWYTLHHNEGWKTRNYEPVGESMPRNKPRKSPAQTIHECDIALFVLAGVMVFIFLIFLPFMNLMDFHDCVEAVDNASECMGILK